MLRPILLVVLLAISLGAADQPADKQPPATRPATRPGAVKDIDVPTFDQMRSVKGTVILDVRTREEYDAGHIPGAVLIDWTEPDFAKRVGQLDKEKVYLVHCATGRRSASACKAMTNSGFTKLHNLLGGIKAWEKAGKEVVKDEQGDSMIRVILNPYGIAYSVGLMGKGTPRASPKPLGLAGYLDLADRIGVGGVEIFTPLLDELDDDALHRLKDRFSRRHQNVVMSQPLSTGLDRSIHCARVLAASIIRCHATPILCGDRNAPDCDWIKQVDVVRELIAHWAPRLAEYGLHLAIENHQDFTSDELMDLCEQGGENVGITFDVGNALSVGEDPVAFATRIKPRIRHIHLKDYRAHWSDEGYRLVRCAIGDGAVPFKQVLAVLDPPHGTLTAAIEPGALHARHIRLLTPGWWKGYAPCRIESVIAALRTARVNRLRENEDWRTPWELEQSHDAIVTYEMAQLDKSVANLKALGLM